MHSSSGCGDYDTFPSIAWPFSRKEDGIGHVGLDTLSIGILGGMLPTIGGYGNESTVVWQPLSRLADRQSLGIVREEFDPVALRPPTRIPGFLKRSKALSHQEMLRQIQVVHRDLDIPPRIILDAIHEATVDTMRESASPFTGNVVAQCRPVLDSSELFQSEAKPTGGRNPLLGVHRCKRDVKPDLMANSSGAVGNYQYGWSTNHRCVLYPGGECGSELWAIQLLPDNGVHYAPYKHDLESFSPNVGPAIEFTTAIRQIAARDMHPGFACVRTDSMVTIVQVTEAYNSSGLNARIHANIVGEPYTYDNGDQWTTHVSWSPWDVSELALASATGAVRLWDCSRGIQTEIKGRDSAIRNKLQWNCCEYWNSPRHFLCASPDLAYYLDSRAGLANPTPLLSLDQSAFAFSNERITTVLPSALNPMHAIVASTHALRVFDQRYPGKPVIAWSMAHMQDDPPVYLHSEQLSNYEDGKAAIILTTSKMSTQTLSFVYGKHSRDSPYVSLEQGMLKSVTSTSTIRETIQDPLAIDSQEHKTLVSAHSFSGDYPTAPLVGLTMCLTFLEKGRKAGGSQHDINEVFAVMACVSVDEVGKVVGRQALIAPRVNATAPARRTIYKQWAGFKVREGALIDGMNIVLQSKKGREEYLERAWSEIRKHSLAYQRVNMQDIYKYLVDGELVLPNSRDTWRNRYRQRDESESKEENVDSNVVPVDVLASALGSILPELVSDRKTAFDLVDLVLAKAPVPRPRASAQLLSWYGVGKKLRRGLIMLKKKKLESYLSTHVPSEVTRVLLDISRRYVKPKLPRRVGVSGDPTLQVLSSLFVAKHLYMAHNAHYESAIMRAAEDIALSRFRIDGVSPPEQAHASSGEDSANESASGENAAAAVTAAATAGPAQKRRRRNGIAPAQDTMRLDLEAKVAALAGAAGAMRDIWDSGNSPIDIPARPPVGRPRSTWVVRSQRERRTKQPLRSTANSAAAATFTATGPLEAMAPSQPALSTQPVDVFSQALFQRHVSFARQSSTAPSQKSKKRKKARKSGF
ncbi:TATA box-binding protein-associated factor RNA polymerase I subunit C [Coemansia sp. RSA 1200]|nr:TATA box-binding protein-associated factor RNA polymerase I subunit C [Coemansia sp. RSA 1200]